MYNRNYITEHAQAKIKGDNHDVAIACQYRPVVRIARIPFVWFSVYENNNREFDVDVFSSD